MTQGRFKNTLMWHIPAYARNEKKPQCMSGKYFRQTSEILIEIYILCTFMHRHSGIPHLRLFLLHIFPQTGVNVVMLKKIVSMLFIFQQTYLHFLGTEMMGSSREKLLVGFHFIPQNPSLITSNYLQKEFWISFKPFLKVLAHNEAILLCSLLSIVSTNLVKVQCTIRLSFKML